VGGKLPVTGRHRVVLTLVAPFWCAPTVGRIDRRGLGGRPFRQIFPWRKRTLMHKLRAATVLQLTTYS
jgi:hypothetical protein